MSRNIMILVPICLLVLVNIIALIVSNAGGGLLAVLIALNVILLVIVLIGFRNFQKKFANKIQALEENQLSVAKSTLNEITKACEMSVRGHLTYRITTFQDEFKNVVVAVNEVLEALHTCFDNIRHPMQVLDRDINVLHFNKTVASYGYSPSEFMGKPLSEIYDMDLHNKYVEAYKIINETKEAHTMRTETPTEQGLIIEDNCIWPIFSNNEIVAYGNITLDITDGIRYREVAEKIMNYQSNETTEIIESLQNELGKGILKFTYKPSPTDKDTAAAAEAFHKIDKTLNHSLSFIKDYVDEVNNVLHAIAGGDLTSRITNEYIGEFSTIKDSINNITNSLHSTMSEVVAASENVLAGADQIAKGAAHLASGATTQADSVQQLHASLELINQQTMQNVTDTNEATALSDKSSQNALEGHEVMKQMLDAMGQIKESGSSISKIISVIQDIAFQTNLLALNASVEAARAGEHGTGFAVVADEVRNLAARSQEAATDTTGLIQETIMSVDIGSNKSLSTAETLDNIVASATEVSQIINRISASSREQADAIGQVSAGINQISSVVQSNSEASQETASTADELNSQAKRLEQLVSQFKL